MTKVSKLRSFETEMSHSVRALHRAWCSQILFFNPKLQDSTFCRALVERSRTEATLQTPRKKLFLWRFVLFLSLWPLMIKAALYLKVLCHCNILNPGQNFAIWHCFTFWDARLNWQSTLRKWRKNSNFIGDLLSFLICLTTGYGMLRLTLGSDFDVLLLWLSKTKNRNKIEEKLLLWLLKFNISWKIDSGHTCCCDF